MGMAGGGAVGAQLILGVTFTVLVLFYAERLNRGSIDAHAPHLLMAAGMVYMTLPVRLQVLPLWLWLAVFGAASTWCVTRTVEQWRRDQHLDLEFAHRELAGCVAMTAMLPLFTVAGLPGALPLTIALGTYFLVCSVFWAWRLPVRRGAAPGAVAARCPRAEVAAQIVMGAGMAFMFLVM